MVEVYCQNGCSNVYWVFANITGVKKWHLMLDMCDNIYFPNIDFSEEMTLEEYREECPDNKIVGPLEPPGQPVGEIEMDEFRFSVPEGMVVTTYHNKRPEV